MRLVQPATNTRWLAVTWSPRIMSTNREGSINQGLTYLGHPASSGVLARTVMTTSGVRGLVAVSWSRC